MNRAVRGVGRAVRVLACAGWIAPLALGTFEALATLDLVQRQLAGTALPTGSFPHLAFARACLWVGFTWLAVVVGTWAITATAARTAKTARHD